MPSKVYHFEFVSVANEPGEFVGRPNEPGEFVGYSDTLKFSVVLV